MSMINKSFAGIVTSLDRALSSNNLESVSQTMDTFERQFENLDVQSECVEAAMTSSMALSTPPDQVDALLTQVAEEHNLQLTLDMPATAPGVLLSSPAAAVANDDLEKRLEMLKTR